MTDIELIEKKLAFIETCIADLRRLAQPEKLGGDLREERFVEHTLPIGPIQSLATAFMMNAFVARDPLSSRRNAFLKKVRGPRVSRSASGP